nr:uncharacterized protein LOC111426168 isoform X2 [Onthophagus taurus]
MFSKKKKSQEPLFHGEIKELKSGLERICTQAESQHPTFLKAMKETSQIVGVDMKHHLALTFLGAKTATNTVNSRSRAMMKRCNLATSSESSIEEDLFKKKVTTAIIEENGKLVEVTTEEGVEIVGNECCVRNSGGLKVVSSTLCFFQDDDARSIGKRSPRLTTSSSDQDHQVEMMKEKCDPSKTSVDSESLHYDDIDDDTQRFMNLINNSSFNSLYEEKKGHNQNVLAAQIVGINPGRPKSTRKEHRKTKFDNDSQKECCEGNERECCKRQVVRVHKVTKRELTPKEIERFRGFAGCSGKNSPCSSKKF